MIHSNALHTSLVDVGTAFTTPATAGWSDDELMGVSRELGEIQRRVDAAAAAVAAEIAHRSRRELGGEGLAQRLGARTPQKLVQQLTGGTSREAATLVRVGSFMPLSTPTGFDSGDDQTGGAPEAGDGEMGGGEAGDGGQIGGGGEAGADERARAGITAERPWLAAVGTAVAAGRLSIAHADVIRAGLGEPDDDVTTEQLRIAAERLVTEAGALTVERLAAAARDARAELDEAKVPDREEQMRQQRFLRLFRQDDGMTRITGLLDPESAALMVSAVDVATSPRRGGPRFVDPDAVEREERILTDPRTPEQIAADTLVELVRIGGAVDPHNLLGTTKPAVRILVTDADLARREGVAEIEGQSAPISIATAERTICEAGTVPILFDDEGQAVNVGREQRLFNKRQRVGIAARDGGCIFPGCDRPPAWTEVHHINEWFKHRGDTDIAHGVLLCRHHHLLIHNNGWRVRLEHGAYYLIPPRSIDPRQEPIAAQTRSRTRDRAIGRSLGATA